MIKTTLIWFRLGFKPWNGSFQEEGAGSISISYEQIKPQHLKDIMNMFIEMEANKLHDNKTIWHIILQIVMLLICILLAKLTQWGLSFLLIIYRHLVFDVKDYLIVLASLGSSNGNVSSLIVRIIIFISNKDNDKNKSIKIFVRSSQRGFRCYCWSDL